MSLTLSLICYITYQAEVIYAQSKPGDTWWNVNVSLTLILEMKTHKGFIRLTTNSKEEVVNITTQVQHVCQDSGIKEGFVPIFPFSPYLLYLRF